MTLGFRDFTLRESVFGWGWFGIISVVSEVESNQIYSESGDVFTKLKLVFTEN
jgi:hypothetical protein